MPHRSALLLVASTVLVAPLAARADPLTAARRDSSPGREPLAPKDLKPVDAGEIRSAIRRGRELLVAAQESLDPEVETKAEWPYEGVYRVKRQIPLGYRIGGTSICARALLDVSGGDLGASERKAVDRALVFVTQHLDDPLMSTDFVEGYDVRGWGHAYALSFLLAAHGYSRGDEQAGLAARIEDLISKLAKTQIAGRGGWNYSRPNGDESAPSTFMTAPTLQILFEARSRGFAVDDAVIERGLESLEDARLESGAFQYGTDPERRTGRGFEDLAGSTGRSPVCETTLLLAGRGSVERVRASLDAFFEHWRWLEQRRKQGGTHVPPYMIAPYYFFYAHRYAAQAIEMLPEAEREAKRAKLYSLLWHVREEDGGWNDRVFPRSESFGTAMTLFALHEPQAARPALWRPPSGGKESK